MLYSEHIAHGYFFAKKYIINKGYANEIDWQQELVFQDLTEDVLIHEFVWVVLASGLNDKVVRKIFPLIKEIMFDFRSASVIIEKKEFCRSKALNVFNHKGKIDSIFYLLDYILQHSFKSIKNGIYKEGINFIQQFPYMGKATSYHLAKNLGLDIAKPDRHLVRISSLLGYDNPNEFCQELSSQINEKASLIDLVLWRYATLDKNYLENIAWYVNRQIENN